MARTAFSGPILSGTQRFNQFRNLGSAVLSQSVQLNLTNTTSQTAGYAGGSGQFVTSNFIPNAPATVYVPQNGSFQNDGPTVQAIPADTASNIYRGGVIYVPTGCVIQDIFVDVQAVPTVAAGSITNILMRCSNTYTAAGGTAAYATTGTISAVGRQALTAFTGTQITNQNGTLKDVQLIQSGGWVSQVVFTLAVVGSADLTTLNAGNIFLTVRYVQVDQNIGSSSLYPYGNFD